MTAEKILIKLGVTQLSIEVNNSVILSVGSNIEPEQHVEKVISILSSEQNLLDKSTFAFTKPVGFQEQDDFYNGALLLETKLQKDEFNKYLKIVEKKLGRIKGAIKSGPRTIDLDIIVWNSKVVHADYPGQNYVKDFVDELAQKHSILLT